MNKYEIKLMTYEEIKNLYINFWGSDNKKMSKLLTTTPNKFVKYVNKHYDIVTRWQVVILEPQGETFILQKDTEQECLEVIKKWNEISDIEPQVRFIKFLKLK
jgi:putative heme iron utilization protein